MERVYDEGFDTDQALMQDWIDAGLNCNRVIKSHRAPRKYPRGAVIISTLVAIGAIGTLVAIDHKPPERSMSAQILNSNAPIISDTPDLSEIDESTWESELEDYRKRNQFIDETSRKKRREVSSNSTAVMKQFVKPKPIQFVYPTTNGYISSCYGPRNGRMHVGIDFAARTGSPIRSVTDGIVVQAGWRYTGLGYTVVVKHAGGVMTMYAHASKIVAKVGQHVRAGTTIALIGSTGHSTGPHLHLNLSKTSSLNSFFSHIVNPAPWLRSHNVNLARC